MDYTQFFAKAPPPRGFLLSGTMPNKQTIKKAGEIHSSCRSKKSESSPTELHPKGIKFLTCAYNTIAPAHCKREY